MLICPSSRVCIEHYPLFICYTNELRRAQVTARNNEPEMNQILPRIQDISRFCVSIHNLRSMFPFLKPGQT